MRWLRIPLIVAGLVASGYGWIVSDDRFGGPDKPLLFNETHLRPPPQIRDGLSAAFTICDGSVRVNCVVDGDTFWYRGQKIRIADINAPEVSKPQCEAEKNVGMLARDRLLIMLNEDAFSLTAGLRDEDRYGRKLRTVWRAGVSLGEKLVAEGLAHHWGGAHHGWCGDLPH